MCIIHQRSKDWMKLESFTVENDKIVGERNFDEPLILELFVNDGKFLNEWTFLTYLDLPRIR